MKPSDRIQELIKEKRDTLRLKPGETTPLEKELAILSIIQYLDEQHKPQAEICTHCGEPTEDGYCAKCHAAAAI